MHKTSIIQMIASSFLCDCFRDWVFVSCMVCKVCDKLSFRTQIMENFQLKFKTYLILMPINSDKLGLLSSIIVWWLRITTSFASSLNSLLSLGSSTSLNRSVYLSWMAGMVGTFSWPGPDVSTTPLEWAGADPPAPDAAVDVSLDPDELLQKRRWDRSVR